MRRLTAGPLSTSVYHRAPSSVPATNSTSANSEVAATRRAGISPAALNRTVRDPWISSVATAATIAVFGPGPNRGRPN